MEITTLQITSINIFKKIIKSILLTFILSISSFAGEIGYVWMSRTNGSFDNVMYDEEFDYILFTNSNKPNFIVGDEIYIKEKNILFKNKESLEKILKSYRKLREKKICEEIMFRYNFYTFSYFYNNSYEDKSCAIEEINKDNNSELFYRINSPIKAKILDMEIYHEGLFLKIDILSEIKKEDFKENENNKNVKEKFLCKDEESTLFSCDTENNKVISFCENKEGTLSYKYGTSEKIELEYSSIKDKNINNYFKYNNLKKNLNEIPDFYEVEFNIGKYTYTLYKYLSRFNINHSGVYVEKEGKKVALIQCVNPEEDNYNKLNLLSSKYKMPENDLKDVIGDIDR